ncbi:putative guanine deaminase [Metarhizium anisopliae]
MESSSKPSGRKSLMLGNFVHSQTPEELKFFLDAAIAVDERGKIVGIDDSSADVHTAKKQLLCRLRWHEHDVDVYSCRRGQFFFPGFIDTHVHASQYPIVGVFGESTLINWLETYIFPCEERFSDEKVARQVYTACVRRTLAHGTTTAAYYATTHVAATNLLAKICFHLGQRAFIGRVCMDRDGDLNPECLRDPSSQEALSRTRKVIEFIDDLDPDYDLVSPILTPRFALSCTPEAMNGLSEMHRKLHLPIQTHISENPLEIKDVADMYPDTGSYVKVYDTYGLLTPKTILGHSVHLSEGEARLISERKSKVAHCPCSNSALGSGEARVRWLWDRDIDVGLGTDMSGGYSPSILEAARQAVLVSRHLAMKAPDDETRKKVNLSVAQVLYLATRGGAKVVGLEDKVGGFEVGKDWDAQLVGLHVVGDHKEGHHKDHGNVDLFEWDLCNWKDIVAKWMYNGDDRNTKIVWVKGRQVHRRPC